MANTNTFAARNDSEFIPPLLSQTEVVADSIVVVVPPVTSMFNLSDGKGKVKQIDFVARIKIPWPTKISCCDKEYWRIKYLR